MSTYSLMKLPAVAKQTTLSKSHIYDLIQRKSFPAPVKLTERSVAWLGNPPIFNGAQK